MANITKLGRVMIPVSDQDAAIGFYTGTLGFTVAADIPFGDGDRWVEVEPPGGGARVALTRPYADSWKPGMTTGIALVSSDVRADHEELRGKGVDVDEELMGGDGTVPPMFGLRDPDGNSLLVVQTE
jgi:catechol 2,3-dioxygenase-like lactoylglutathione lyase family enzyme